MSNGDDVLDNWEDLDETQLNLSLEKLKTSTNTSNASVNQIITNQYITSQSFSHQENESLYNRLNHLPNKSSTMKLLQRSPTTQELNIVSKSQTDSDSHSQTADESPLNDMAAAFQPVMMLLHKPTDEYQSANYTSPITNQTVKILRRPTQNTELRNNDTRPKQPLKSLKQREQEYAEARLRILGSAKNPEDENNVDENCTEISSDELPMTTSQLNVQITTKTTVNRNPIVGAGCFTDSTQQPLLMNPYHTNYQYSPQLYYYPIQQVQQQQLLNKQVNDFNRASNIQLIGNMPPVHALGTLGQSAQYQSQQTQLKYQLQGPQYNKVQQQCNNKNHQQQHPQTWSPVIGGAVSSFTLRQQSNDETQQDTILRLPRGPDGTTGFQMRR